MKLTGKGRRRKPRGTERTAGRVIRAPGPPRVRWIGGTALLICVFIHKERVVFQKEGCMSCRSWNSCVISAVTPCMLRPPASRAESPAASHPPAQTGSAAAMQKRLLLETRVSHFGCKVTYSM